MNENMRYAFFWRRRGAKAYTLEEFEANGFNEALRVARAMLEAGGGEVGYLVAGVLAAEVRKGQKFAPFLHKEHD